MSATIFDVAKRAGVSIGTVSRVVNNRDRVHPETRERVLKAIRDLNFQANAFARGLASQRTNMLGLVIPQVNDSFFFQIFRGVNDEAAAIGYTLVIVSQPRQGSERRYLDLFRRGHVDAMILVAIDARRADIKQIQETGVPVVLIQQDGGSQIPMFVVDNYGGGRQIAEHLVGHGYQRFAYITGSDFTPDSGERLRGLRDVLQEHGLSIDDNDIVRGDFLEGSGYRAALELLQRPQMPRAIFAANDQMAADAIRAVQDQGLRVPDDVAVVGFDDVPLASYVTPRLTTVHQPTYELGREAARMVFSVLQRERDQNLASRFAPRVQLPTTLIVRRSCGCEE
ncbi:MAG: LacI family DNA-binding transcriptional regulator [Anaerolineae bacterium]|nr:LacI family DNA-binding transcriptional regulator [Anaerolineae bacterium]